MQNNNYWQLEEELIVKYGEAKVTDALAQLEEDYGTNGLDAYRSGDHHLLLDIIEG